MSVTNGPVQAGLGLSLAKGGEVMAGHWSEKLKNIGSCYEALEWSALQVDIETAWRTCRRGDWMLWLIGRLTTSVPWSEDRKQLVKVVCEVAHLSLRFWESEHPGDSRIRNAIEVTEQWTRGEARKEEVQSAADAVYDASYSAYTTAYATAYAAAYTTAYATAYAAAGATAYAGARILAECADIVRAHYPDPPEWT